MKEEVCYVCEWCGKGYGLKEDAEDCESSCQIVERLCQVSRKFDEFLRSEITDAERVKLGKVINEMFCEWEEIET